MNRRQAAETPPTAGRAISPEQSAAATRPTHSTPPTVGRAISPEQSAAATRPTHSTPPTVFPASPSNTVDLVFDAPVDQSFTYRVPPDLTVAPGQRVAAPLGSAERVGLVVAIRSDAAPSTRLRPLTRLVDPTPLLGPAALALVRHLAAESLTSLGSTALALLPPPHPSDASTDLAPPAPADGATELPLVLTGGGRERRLLELIAADARPALVIVSDVDGAVRWAQRLERLGPVVRLDSGAGEAERAAAWQALATGRARLAVGTRSALLAPLAAGAIAAVIDEHDPAHKPPGPPRLHARDVVLERRTREAVRVVLTSATPSVETWSRCEDGAARLVAVAPGPWPRVTIADPRGIARREALTPPLARAMREALGAGRRVFLGVTRVSSALGCDECGAILRCDRCGVALGWSPTRRRLVCRLCGDEREPPDVCRACGGRRLMAFGWGVDRVEQSVRRRFASARIARYDPDARGRRSDEQRAAAAAADVVIGTRGALKLFGPGALGLAGFISPDQLLGVPDFRAAERTFAVLWAAAERVRADGELIIQSRNPSHYALDAVARQDRELFYRPELTFRAELGYPPFRRLAVIVARPRPSADDHRLIERLTEALGDVPDLVTYPAVELPGRRGWRLVVKGGPDLPRALAAALGDLLAVRRRTPGIMDVEVDPVEWPF